MSECRCPNCGHEFDPQSDPDWRARVIPRRKAIGMTQKELAHRLGLSPQFINDVEHGRRYVPSLAIRDQWEHVVFGTEAGHE